VTERRDKKWFEMRDVTRPRLAAGLWVPLLVSEERSELGYKDENSWSEYNYVRTFAVLRKDRAAAEEMDFSSVADNHGPSVYGKKYHSTEVVLSRDEKPLGVRLALVQHFHGDEESIWSLNQDLVFALGLVREGDAWVSPRDGYDAIAEVRRNARGKIVGLYIKPEYLKDYLAARKMALRIVQFRQRRATLRSDDRFGWDKERHTEERDGGTFRGYASSVGGEGVMVMHVGRTDDWSADELPELGPPTDENTVSDSKSFNRPDHGLHAIEGEFRRSEWLEPATHSPRVGHDSAPSAVTFIVDPSGHRMSADDLDDEDIGKWLWFKPTVIPEILSRRGAELVWSSLYTAGISLVPGYSVHFGVNLRGLVVTYARDVATLAEWQRAIWAGFNIAPEGGLPDELKTQQVVGEYADTQAPEEFFGQGLDAINNAAKAKWGWPVFKDHASKEEIAAKVHRFRSLDEAGFLALAKDIARLTADSIDAAKLQSLLTLEKSEKLASLKSLERALGTLVPAEDARRVMSVLFGVYDLRLADAHLPSEKLNESYGLAGVSMDEPLLERAAHLIHNVTSTLFRIAKMIEDATKPVDTA
jgi:hypothetical protein